MSGTQVCCLLARTVVALNHANSGFDKYDVLTMEVRLPDIPYNPSSADEPANSGYPPDDDIQASRKPSHRPRLANEGRGRLPMSPMS